MGDKILIARNLHFLPQPAISVSTKLLIHLFGRLHQLRLSNPFSQMEHMGPDIVADFDH